MGHHPETVAHEIKWPFSKKTSFGTYKKTLVTIWHNDPCTDRTDNSCGWFVRARHLCKKLREDVHKEFLFHYKHNYWFDATGKPVFSVPGTVLNMFHTAIFIYFDKKHNKAAKWMSTHLAELLLFSENYIDSLHSTITRRYGGAIDEEFMKGVADTILCYIVRKERPWYKHPRWHIRHWSIQIHWPQRRPKDRPVCDDNLRDTI